MELPAVFSRACWRATLIPVDPYYLVHRAEELGYHPQVILAGRAINDSMLAHVAGMMVRGLNEVGKVIKGFTVFECGASAKPSNFCEKFASKKCPPGGVLIMGLAYKENVPDTRESPARGIVEGLREFGVLVYGYDPVLTRDRIEGFGVKALDGVDPAGTDTRCALGLHSLACCDRRCAAAGAS